MRVAVNKEKCLRSGQCMYMHPKIFDEGPDGFPVVLAEDVPVELKAEAEDAADICPSSAITLVEE
ncbi:MAG: ferredoxin [Dehalococcoidia bacterium]|nr:ferredoxin [Dehalococcoidia bacterium]